MGFRYKKEVNGETHNYIFDGWSITAETNKDGELKSREVRGYGLVKKEIDNNSYFYHQNEHGDITHLTNTDEEIENSYQYDVFGNIREQQENVENIFKYAGEQLDNETQQYYLRARFYNPVIARFTQEDVYRGNGLNLYVYVVNNPLLWIDPSGYEKCELMIVNTESNSRVISNNRNSPGIVTGGENSYNGLRMMKGKQGNIGIIPQEVANRLRDREFSNFDEFRREFWKQVAGSSYANEFSTSNISRMSQGFAPKVIKEQKYGELSSYVLHHKVPIHAGGGVYDLDNLIVVTPQMHQQILDTSYHFGH